MNKAKTVAVIPARYASTRLPGKLLLELDGKSIIERVYEQVSKAKLVDKVIIATDSEKIFEHAQKFGAEVYMTSVKHQSGTDRIAELALQNNDWEVIVNVQGDEPFINPDDIDKAVEPFNYDPQLEMLSLYHDLFDIAEIRNPNNVKVVTDINNNALYFSRSMIPHVRQKTDAELELDLGLFKKHIGLYVYRRDTLLTLSKLPATTLEKLEKLEQLRALENGINIKMISVTAAPIGIDTPEDFEQAKLLLN